MNSRDAILHRIRTRLSSGPTVAQPPVPEVWPRENPDRQTMAARFAEELTAIFGEVIRCDSMAVAQKRLAELVENPSVLVSESGIKTRQDVERLAAAGVNTILIGETLMRSESIPAKIDELFGPVRP